MVRINGKRRKKEDWLIICRQTYFRTTFHKRQQMLLRSSFIKKGGNLFADHKFNCSACVRLQNECFHFRESVWMLSLLFCDMFLLCQGENVPTSCMQDKRQSPRCWCLWREGGGMKHRRLIETQSTPCLRAAILLAEDTYCGNYQSLKIMCNRRLELDIKRESHHIWLTKASL